MMPPRIVLDVLLQIRLRLHVRPWLDLREVRRWKNIIVVEVLQRASPVSK